MRLLAVLLIALSCCAAEPAPAWVGDAGRQATFPDGEWLVGWSEESVTDERSPDACAVVVRDAAQAELARSIRVRVEAVTDEKAVQITGSTGSRFDQSFSSQSRLSSDITLVDRKLETWYDEKAARVHAIAAVQRRVFADALRARADATLAELEGVATSTQAIEDAGRLAEAKSGWAKLVPGLHDLGEDLILARGVQRQTQDDALTTRFAALQTRVATATARIAGRAVTSADDLVFVLANQLAASAGEAKPLVQVPTFTVRDSRLSSPLGRYLAQSLATQLATAAGWKVTKASAAGQTRDAAAAAGVEAVVLGATWDRPDGVRCIVSVHAIADGRVLAAAEATLPKAGLDETGLAATPQNAQQALADQQQFRQDEIIGGGMKVEVWTSKGDDAPVFLKDETVKLFVRVDRPAHLRIVYHLADGRRAMLVDDLYIDEAKANQVYELPDEFVVSAPFGAETIQANVSTAAFPKLAVREEDGYPILAEELAAANIKTRGLKKKQDVEVRQAEARVVVTTIER